LSQPSLSIVIAVYNRAAITRQCLNTLLTQDLEQLGAEIVVVDDGSRDLTARLLATYGQRIRVVTHAVNAGFATACNDGAGAALGEWLVFLNNDTIPRRGWLAALQEYAAAHPRAAVVGSKLLYPNDTIQHAGVVFTGQGLPLHVYAGLPKDHPAVNKSRQFQAVTGACMMVRRTAFEAVGGFDQAYCNVYEDVDLCLRLGEQGHQVHYCHTSEVVHLEALTRNPTNPGVSAHDHAGDIARSAELYLQRWKTRVTPDHFRYYEADGLLTLQSGHPYPLRMAVSPELASVESMAEVQAHRLVASRSEQVYALLQENARLKARLQDLELHMQASLSAVRDATTPMTWPELRTRMNLFEVRAYVACLFLQGSGIEIGALASPLPVPPGVRVTYIDRMRVADLRQQYPELDGLPMVEADIIDDGEVLASIPDGSQDFAIANHYVEHCEDPIGAIGTLLRVLKPGGVIYMAIPDKRYTFDLERPVTPLDHLLRDHADGPRWSKHAHFAEWAELVNHKSSTAAIAAETERLLDMAYSIHYHVWTQAELFELMATMQRQLDLRFDVELFVKNEIEALFVLRKHAAPVG
jgi:GT2 family glycosyltransferase/SAM-dependent methyltransferase